MLSKTPAIISIVLTIIILLVFAVLSVLTQMLALNGASERQGVTALGISLGCQGIALIAAAILASRLTKTFIEKFKWNNIVSITVAVIAATIFGALMAFLSILISIPAAGIS